MPTTKRERAAQGKPRAQDKDNGRAPSGRDDLSAFAKDVRDLLRDMKAGFRVERTGGGHFRIRDAHGNFVTGKDGKNLTLVTSPSPGTVRALREELTEARILRGTAQRQVSDEGKENRRAGLKRMSEARDAIRRDEAKAIHERMKAVLDVVGGLNTPGLAQDLGYVGSVVARDMDVDHGRPMTPDLLSSSARRVINGDWTERYYLAVWNAVAERLERAPEGGGEWYSIIRQAKGLPADAVELRLPKGAQDEWPFRVALLPHDALFVDTYQRPVAWAFVRKEAARFDHALVGTIDVAARAPGRFAILDGQQRVEMVRLVGKGTIWCSIYEGLDFASEARFFLHKNRDRKNMHPYYTYQAMVIANDPEALGIEGLLKKHGYQIAIGAPRQGAEDHIAAISAVQTAYRRDTLDTVLATLKASTFGRENGQTAVLIRGVSLLYRDSEADPEIVGNVLAEVGPTTIIGRARDLSRQTGTNNEQAVARVIAAEYDKRAKGRGSKLGWV